MEQEIIWKRIPEFEDYEINNYGDIRSWIAKGVELPHLMKPHVNSKGYKHLILRKNGKPFTRKVGRLVALVFIGPCPNGLQVAHEDGNPSNNNVNNLTYKTPMENTWDKFRHGTMLRGERIENSILTEEQVLEIYFSKSSSKELGKKYNVNRLHINRIKRQETWKHIVGDLPPYIPPSNSRKYMGVIKQKKGFKAMIKHKNKEIIIGKFATEEEAAKAYDAKLIELHGKKFKGKAKLNFPNNYE